jgi:hypothetical protein
VASYVPGELIPCAFVWLDPGITPCRKSRRFRLECPFGTKGRLDQAIVAFEAT